MENHDFLYPAGVGRASGRRAWARSGLALALLMALGCAAPVTSRRSPSGPASTTRPAARGLERGESITIGVDHVVLRGQTLWRIAAAYGIDLDDLARANGIDDPTKLATGQALFIPGADVALDVPAYVVPADELGSGDRDSRAGRTGGERWAWPVANPTILSNFGAPRRSRHHAGIDLRGEAGTAVVSSRAGRVIYSGSGLSGYGKTIVVDHGDGTSALYAHNSRLLVRDGQTVDRGEAIAQVGRSGNATTEHCHFEIRLDGRPVDPLIYLDPGHEARR